MIKYSENTAYFKYGSYGVRCHHHQFNGAQVYLHISSLILLDSSFITQAAELSHKNNG